jgi:hypothetical protein
MVTRSNRSKAAQRIENAKIAYGLAEKRTDSLLMRFADSPWTMAIIAVISVAILVLVAM